ncbi:MAG: hypothetical protein BGP06_02590 [Rhizobiales bacterium 65-9]|nr:MAG: hypothetical protein BGP06_02590 [Rhizobiales bacterium 65-9]
MIGRHSAMRRWSHLILGLLSAALLIGYAAAFVARWGLRGLIVAVVFGALLILAAVAGTGVLEGRGPRLLAAGAYAVLAGAAFLFLIDALKNDIIRDLLIVQAATGVAGLVVCALPRRE